jgi:hypothetical protein
MTAPDHKFKRSENPCIEGGIQTWALSRLAAVQRITPFRDRLNACVDGSCIARVFGDCDGLSVQSCVRPVCVAIATGPDEFRKQGSYRVYDL